MTPAEHNYGALLILWGRTIEEHKIASFEEWLLRRYREKIA